MKTSKDFTELDFNQLAFFKGIFALDAKWELASFVYAPTTIKTTPKGMPVIGKNDKIPVDKCKLTMKSNSNLEGKSRLEYLCDYYNKGTDNQHLKQYAEKETYIKALKFTGINSVLNDILNKDQLLRLQKSWLFANVYDKKYLSDKAIKFIENNKWAKLFLEEKGINIEDKKELA